ncbi:hypothetical protein [Psychroflexus sp. MES1-P1E]|uniref:hypothetical protein n=1 Tax=Psychroflexus sp. MES1-P1E TaxID=2058320 RepID=UPI000C7B22FB|nr:hypothetical protein [Psychroflexus sp. MES1-P1E]PKG42655.1 hypothetical protein CXF67_09115 [Psychroflexus sp. MES1-P1E]
MKRILPDDNSLAHLKDEFFNEKIELVELLMYPLETRNPWHFEKIEWTLFDTWRKVCSNYMIDHEYRYIYFDYYHSYDNQEPWEDEISEVRRAKENALKWIDKAKNQMEELCGVLYSQIADRNLYPKHYPRFKETNERMRTRSKKDAVLAHSYTVPNQTQLLVQVIEHFFPIIVTEKDSVFIIERGQLTGYSEAKDCSKLVCKINKTTNIVHFYPVHDDELFKYKKTYDNPAKSNDLLILDEFDDNEHLKGDTINNSVEILD